MISMIHFLDIAISCSVHAKLQKTTKTYKTQGKFKKHWLQLSNCFSVILFSYLGSFKDVFSLVMKEWIPGELQFNYYLHYLLLLQGFPQFLIDYAFVISVHLCTYYLLAFVLYFPRLTQWPSIQNLTQKVFICQFHFLK